MLLRLLARLDVDGDVQMRHFCVERIRDRSKDRIAVRQRD